MKKLLFLLPIILFFSCTPIIKNDPVINKPSANATITDVYQDYYSSLGDYGYVEFFYEIKNTGNCLIDYYKVYFEVTCKDGAKYTDWDNGANVDIGQVAADYTMIYTSWKQYDSIRITNIELTSY